MREFGILMASVAIIIGLLLLLAPKLLVRVGEQTNKLYNIDGLIYRNRYFFGSFLVLASLFLAYTAL